MSQTASNLVSASSSIYQVFINHRGVDVKKTLGSLIYWRLRKGGYSVFLDEEELRVGDTSPLVIQGTIESSSVCICIFSRRYCESEWCLNELCRILRSWRDRRTKIIPVFYDVEPSDLQGIESGPFARAFEDHRLQGRDTDIVEWRAALNEASQICGFVFKTSESDHGDILERIVKDVITEILKQEPEIVKREPLEVSPHPVVGLEQAVEDLQSTIEQFDLHETVLIVGIVGVEGVGKSTLARHFYNLKRLGFSRSCFLSKVSKSRDNLSSLQHNLLCDLLGYSYSEIQTVDINKGKNLLKGLRSKRVAIVFDGVDDIEQIKSVLNIDYLGQGSLIVITSFNPNVFRRFSRTTPRVLHNVKPLQEHYARELFCWCAFGQSQPREGFQDLVDETLKLCGGMPLSLTVLGKEVSVPGDEVSDMQHRNAWKSQLKKWSRTGLPPAVMNHLNVMFEVLNCDEKKVFLDIGCSLLGADKDCCVAILENAGHNDVSDCMDSLRRKGLLEYETIIQCQPQIERQEEQVQASSNYQPQIERQEEQGNGDLPDGQSPRETYKIGMNPQIKELANQMCWIRNYFTRDSITATPPQPSVEVLLSTAVQVKTASSFPAPLLRNSGISRGGSVHSTCSERF